LADAIKDNRALTSLNVSESKQLGIEWTLRKRLPILQTIRSGSKEPRSSSTCSSSRYGRTLRDSPLGVCGSMLLVTDSNFVVQDAKGAALEELTISANAWPATSMGKFAEELKQISDWIYTMVLVPQHARVTERSMI
jgi:hypothetical protein